MSARSVFIESVWVAGAIALVLCGAMILLAPDAASRLMDRIGTGRVAPGGNRLTIVRERSLPEPALGASRQPDGYNVQFAHADSFGEAVARVREGDADAGYALSVALAGQEGLAGAASLGKRFLYLIAPADAAVRGIADLAGKKVGMAHAGPHAVELFESLVETYALVNPPQLTNEHDADLEEAFLEGQINAALLLCGHDEPTIAELLATGWYALVPIPEAEALALRVPGLFADVIPVGLYGPERGIPAPESGPLPTVSVATLLYTRADAPDEPVQALARRARDASEGHRSDWDKTAPLPLHPAAAQLAAGVPVPRPVPSRAVSVALGGLCVILGVRALWVRSRARRRARRRRVMMREISSLLEQTAGMLEVGNVEIPDATGQAKTVLLRDFGRQAQAKSSDLLASMLECLRSQHEAVLAMRTQIEALQEQLALAHKNVTVQEHGLETGEQETLVDVRSDSARLAPAGDTPFSSEQEEQPQDQMSFGF